MVQAKTAVLLFLSLIALTFDMTNGHSWMVNPSPFRNAECRVDRPGRQINDFGRIIIGNMRCEGPCEDGRDFNAGTPYRFHRGQGITVSWLRNGHGLGGGVRWSIVNVDKSDFRNKGVFNERAFHVECFVQNLVDCGGPCGTDNKRYESSLRIPNTLPDGRYRLQWIWFGGPDPSPNGNFGDYYNCADVYINGGDFSDQHRVANPPTCFTISTRVGDCAEEPCRTGEGASFKRMEELPEGKVLGSGLWGGNGGGNNPPPPPPQNSNGRSWPHNGRTFHLHSVVNPDLCLDAGGDNNGAVVHLWTCHNGNNQRWTVEDTGNGIMLVNKQNQKVLDIDAGAENGRRAQLWQKLGSPNQRFHIRDEGNWEYGLVVDQHGAGKGLDVAEFGKAPGARVQQWGYNKQANQKWIFTPA